MLFNKADLLVIACLGTLDLPSVYFLMVPAPPRRFFDRSMEPDID